MAALLAGPLSRRAGLARILLVASLVYGSGFLVGGLAGQWRGWYLAPVFLVAIAGGLVMTLAWGLLFTLMPEDAHGGTSGLATTTKCLGLIVGPLAAGAAIDLFGYRALWPICGLLVLGSVPLLVSLVRAEGGSTSGGTPGSPSD